MSEPGGGSANLALASGMDKLTVTGTEVKATPFQPCGNCGKKYSKACGNCRKESYCSVICQKAQRKQHKLICFPAQVETCEGIGACRQKRPGSFWVATRDIEEGERIFTDYPIMIGPGVEDHVPSEFICLGCHDILKNFVVETDRRKCGQCGWPLCGLNCSGIHRHLKECVQLQLKRATPYAFESHLLHTGVVVAYDSIRQMRLLTLCEQDPIKREQILNLHLPESVFNRIFDTLSIDTAKLDIPAERCREAISPMDAVPKEAKKIISRIIATEKYHHRRSYQPSGDKAELIIYDKETRLDVSCMENCLIWQIPILENKKKDPHGIAIVAAKPIRKGERLCKSYEQYRQWDGTKRRHQILLQKAGNVGDGEIGFICKCARCVDPTELGTNVSAVKCTKCKSGHLLPLNPLEQNSNWKCDSQSQICTALIAGSIVDNIVDKFQQEADVLTNGLKFFVVYNPGPLGAQSLVILDALEKFVEKCEKKLSPHHYVLLNVQESIINIYTCFLHDAMGASLNPQMMHMKGYQIHRLRTMAEIFLDLGSKIFPPLGLPQIYARYYLGMSNFFAAQEAVRGGGKVYVILNWLKEGVTYKRIVDTRLEKLMPHDEGYEYVKTSLRKAYDIALELCRSSSNYHTIPEKLLEFELSFG